MLADGECAIYLYHLENNWMQGWEGEMDTVHAAFLHGGATRIEDTQPGTFAYYQARQRDAKFAVIDTEWGTSYGVRRPAEEDTYYWRIAHQLFPFYAMIPTGVLGLEVRFRAYVPMDDDNTLIWTVNRLGNDPSRAPSAACRRAGTAVRLRLPAYDTGLAGTLAPEAEPEQRLSRSTATCRSRARASPASAASASRTGRHRQHGPDLRPRLTSTWAPPTR